MRKYYTPAMRRGAARDLAAMGKATPSIGFFGTCLCEALIITEDGVEYDWRFGVYPRTRRSCLATIQQDAVRQLPELRAETDAHLAKQKAQRGATQAQQDVSQPVMRVMPKSDRGVLNLGND